MLAPAVEALGESLGLLVLEREEQLARPLGLHGLHVLDVYLRRLVGELDLDLGALGAEPQEHLLAVVQDHYVVVREVVLGTQRDIIRLNVVINIRCINNC